PAAPPRTHGPTAVRNPGSGPLCVPGPAQPQRRSRMAWICLVLAGLLEVVWAVGLKYSEGFTRPLPGVATAVAMAGSFWLLATALKTIPLGTGYAVWVGIGAVGTALVGMLLFREPAGVARLLCIGLIVAGIAGLKLTSR